MSWSTGTTRALTTDLGFGGLSMVCDRTFRVGKELEVSIPFEDVGGASPETEARRRGQVAWTDGQRVGISFDATWVPAA